MPDAPWRCSQCGTVNEPVANACRTCGRWPSLFDLEESQLEAIPPINPGAPATRAVTVEERAALPPDPEPMAADDVPAEVDGQDVEEVDDVPSARPWRRLLRFAVPVGVALYFLISSALDH